MGLPNLKYFFAQIQTYIPKIFKGIEAYALYPISQF